MASPVFETSVTVYKFDDSILGGSVVEYKNGAMKDSAVGVVSYVSDSGDAITVECFNSKSDCITQTSMIIRARDVFFGDMTIVPFPLTHEVRMLLTRLLDYIKQEGEEAEGWS